MIFNRKDLGEAVLGALVGAALVAAAGQTATKWLLNILLVLYAIAAISTVGEAVDLFSWKYAARKQRLEDEREQTKLEAEERREQAEYDAFLTWAAQNPRTVDRLLAIVEYEQINDPQHLTYLRERRDREGSPNRLTDLPRLFDWLKARRELQKFGIDPPLPPL